MDRHELIKLTSVSAEDEFTKVWQELKAETSDRDLIASTMFAAGYLARRNDELNAKKPQYEVVVGNIGTIYSGVDKVKSMDNFRLYRETVRDRGTRCYGEAVTLLEDGEIIREHDSILPDDGVNDV